MTTIATLSPLSTPEQRKLAQYEETIDKGMKSFVEVGQSLMAIQESRLYRAEFESFDAYCKKRWGYAKSYAYRLIESAKVVATCSQIGDIDPPDSEAQTRILAGLPTEEKQADVWAKAVEIATVDSDIKPRVTAGHVRKAIQQIMQPAVEEVGDEEDEIDEGPDISDEQPAPIFAMLAELPDDMAEAFESFKLSILRHKLSGWTAISRDGAIDVLLKLRELALSPSE